METFPRRLTIAQLQIEQLRALLASLRPGNRFYTAKLEAAGFTKTINNLTEYFDRFPFTFKQELSEDQRANPVFGTNLSYPVERYRRCHQTSGTSATPLRWLDTAESWNWMVGGWEYVLRTAGVTFTDRVFFAFSFGPFLGFWLAFEAATRLGCLCFPGGNLNSNARLQAILELGATVLCCTPTYALRLAEVAAQEKIDLAASKIRIILVAGEPGGSIPGTRARIEQLWPGARVRDHHGMTEVGPVTFECPERPCVLHVMENSYIAEVIDPATGRSVGPSETGELVLTSLGRTGSPLLRYRTGDLVKTALDSICQCGRTDLALEGGILGRTDDMVLVRGVNVYPNAVEEIIRSCGGVAEYQAQISTQQSLTELTLRIEPTSDCADPAALAQQLERALSTSLSLRVPVQVAPAGTLPRFEMKARRWIRT